MRLESRGRMADEVSTPQAFAPEAWIWGNNQWIVDTNRTTACDIFALGVTIYETVTGRIAPWFTTGQKSTLKVYYWFERLRTHLRDGVVDATSHVDTELQQLLLNMLAPAALQRPPLRGLLRSDPYLLRAQAERKPLPA